MLSSAGPPALPEGLRFDSLVDTQFRGKSGVFGRALPAKTPPSSHQLRKPYDIGINCIRRSMIWSSLIEPRFSTWMGP